MVKLDRDGPDNIQNIRAALVAEAQARKDTPVYSGFVVYFRLAMEEVARLSKDGNEQHNPGSPLHWDRAKSGDELDALTRHLLDEAAPELQLDEAILCARAVAWRAMANLQKLCEKRYAADETDISSRVTD